jgi:hypothetical protein
VKASEGDDVLNFSISDASRGREVKREDGDNPAK